MKNLIITIAAIGVVVGLYFYAKTGATKHLATERAERVVQTEEQNFPPVAEPAANAPKGVVAANAPETPTQTTQTVRSIATTPAAPVVAEEQIFQQNLATLLSAQSTFPEKQAAWKTFRNPIELDRLISVLGERLTLNPQSPEYSALLGQAYMKKCGQTQEMREQAILAMKADQLLESALNLDPSNWDARFTKAVGMSYWPSDLNKGQEVIEEFTTLIQQQEALPPQPHFARTYAWLGDQYRKAGQADNARQVWERGAVLFPADAELKTKLAVQP